MGNPFQEHIQKLIDTQKSLEGPPVSAPKPPQASDTTAEDQQRLEKYRAWKRHEAGGGAISPETREWIRAYEQTHPGVK